MFNKKGMKISVDIPLNLLREKLEECVIEQVKDSLLSECIDISSFEIESRINESLGDEITLHVEKSVSNTVNSPDFDSKVEELIKSKLSLYVEIMVRKKIQKQLDHAFLDKKINAIADSMINKLKEV